MQEKKNIGLLISLAVLIVLTAIIYWFNFDNGSLEIDKTIFRVDDFKSIDKITFESKAGKVELKFNGTRWRVNEKYEADRNLVALLFATLQEVEPKRPAASSLMDSLSHVIESEGVKVSLFTADNKLQAFYAGGNIQKTQSYFKQDGEGTLYIMVIPGYRDYASGILELDENGWRDKRIFNFNWENFKELTATFSAAPGQNFKVAFSGKRVGIEGLTQIDTAKLNKYLDAVSLLNAGQFIPQNYFARYDSLAKTQPSVIIEVKDVAGRSYQLAVFHPIKNDSNVLGRIGANEFVLFNRKSIVPLVKGNDYFVQKPL